MEEEKKYPVYRFFASWNQKDYKNNGTGLTKMYDHDPTELELEETFAKFKNNIVEKHEEVEWLDTGYKFIENETWSIQYFNHFTFNKFENNRDAMSSFEKFVNRKKKLNINNGHYNDGERNPASEEPYYCLMGAEDRYRWEVCHCEYCKKGDWTIINH